MYKLNQNSPFLSQKKKKKKNLVAVTQHYNLPDCNTSLGLLPLTALQSWDQLHKNPEGEGAKPTPEQKKSSPNPKPWEYGERRLWR